MERGRHTLYTKKNRQAEIKNGNIGKVKSEELNEREKHGD